MELGAALPGAEGFGFLGFSFSWSDPSQQPLTQLLTQPRGPGEPREPQERQEKRGSSTSPGVQSPAAHTVWKGGQGDSRGAGGWGETTGGLSGGRGDTGASLRGHSAFLYLLNRL